jgi:outer membrane beta-barrel protein
MRFLPLCATLLIAGQGQALADPPVADADEVHAVQRRPLREAKRLELTPYGSVSIGDPYLQRWGGGLRAMWHAREGLSLGLDASGFATYATQELVIAKRELHARIIESRQRLAVAAVAAIAPLYGKVALPGDAIAHFETFFDAGLGGALTETDAGRGLRPMLVAGVGQRISLGENLALTGRVGGNVYAEREVVSGRASTKAMGFWTVSLGLSFYLPGARDR